MGDGCFVFDWIWDLYNDYFDMRMIVFYVKEINFF